MMPVDLTKLLHAALSEGNERAARFLLKHGADPNGRSWSTGEVQLRPFQRLGCELAPRGAREGRRSNSLVHRSANPMVPIPSCGSSTLQLGPPGVSRYSSSQSSSCWDSSLEAVVVCARNPTALHVAVVAGKPAPVELLLEAGAEIEARMEGEYTPLALAVIGRRLEIARLLLTRGASVDATARRDKKRPLHFAVRARRPDMASLLLKHGADPSAGTRHGVTALHIAAERNLPGTVELLLRSGADVNARTATGVTPLHCAAVKGHEQITRMILSSGADVSVIVRKGEVDVAPLLWVTEDERRKITEILAKHVAESRPTAGFYGRVLKKIWRHVSGQK